MGHGKIGKIRVKFFMFIVSIFIPILIFEATSISNDRKQIIQSKLDSALYLSEAISNSFEVYIDNLWTQEGIISTYILNHPDLAVEEISSYLRQVVDNQETIQNLFWLDDKGMITASTNFSMIGTSLMDRKYIHRIFDGENKVLSDLVISINDKRPVLPIAKAIKVKGKLAGIIVACINVEKMGSIFSNLLFDEGDIFTLVDREGTIVYCNIAPYIHDEGVKIDPDSPAWQAMEGAVVKTQKHFFESRGYNMLECSYPIDKVGWALSVGSKYDDVIKNVRNKTFETIMVFEVMLLISFIIALLMGEHIITPIIKLKNAAYSIMNGDYSVRTDIEGNDEIAITAQTFNSMAESIEKHDKQKSQFFINLSHELKTPLNVILASLQLIDIIHITSETCRNYKKISEQLSLMKQNCYRLIRMVSNLIDLSKYDNGYLKLKFGNHNIVNIVEDITMSIVNYAQTKKLEIVFDTDIEEKIIRCDPDAIERIMLNLISNALKFTEEGGSIFVTIMDGKDKILISVKDTGIGIPPDKLELIFERFKQVDSSLSRNNEGSGIGLSLVKALVEAHGGKIFVNSILNQGSDFIVDLPAILMEDKIDAQADAMESTHSKIVQRINLEFSDIYEFRNSTNETVQK